MGPFVKLVGLKGVGELDSWETGDIGCGLTGFTCSKALMNEISGFSGFRGGLIGAELESASDTLPSPMFGLLEDAAAVPVVFSCSFFRCPIFFGLELAFGAVLRDDFCCLFIVLVSLC